MHWEQFIATCSAFAVVAAAGAAVYFPYRQRREARVAAKVVERDTALKAAIAAGVVTQTEQIKSDTIARIDESDADVKASLRELKTDVAQLRAHVAESDLNLARQFGGNGGGMRQAIDEQSRTLASLAGRFEQHIIEAAK